MTVWIASARTLRPPARRDDASRSVPLTPLSCVVDTGDVLEPRECDTMRFCADPTIRLTLACSAPVRKPTAWHPWEG